MKYGNPIFTLLLAIYCVTPADASHNKKMPYRVPPPLPVQTPSYQEQLRAHALINQSENQKLFLQAAQELEAHHKHTYKLRLITEIFADPAQTLGFNDVIAELEKKAENHSYTPVLQELQETRAFYQQYALPETVHAQQEEFVKAVTDGIVTNHLHDIACAEPSQALKAYADLKTLWPWDHDHTGFAAATYSRCEIEFNKALGGNIIENAEACLLSRPDILQDQGYTIDPSYTQLLVTVAKNGETVKLYSLQKALEQKLTEPVNAHTPDQRLQYQAQLVHIKSILNNQFEPHYYPTIISGNRVQARTALERLHSDIRSLSPKNQSVIQPLLQARYGNDIFNTAQKLYQDRYDCPPYDKQELAPDTELSPYFLGIQKYPDLLIATALFHDLTIQACLYAHTKDNDVARRYCIEKRGYDVFAVAHELLTSRSDYQPGTVEPLPSLDSVTPLDVTHEIATTLDSSYSYDLCRNRIFETVEQVLSHAQLCQYTILPERKAAIKEAIETLKNAHDAREFATSVITLDLLINDLENDIITLGHPNNRFVTHKLDQLIKSLEKFFTTINEYTHIQESLELMVLTIRFASDITVGRLYLSEKKYKERMAQFWDAIKYHVKAHAATRLIRAAQDIACTVHARGLAAVKEYLRELNSVDKMSTFPSMFAQGCKKALNNVLAKQPFLVTNHNLIVSSRELPEPVTAHDLTVQSHGKIRDVINTADKVIQTNVLNEGFIAGTLVNTPHGYVKIEDLRVNDVIYSRDQADKPYQCRVTDVYQHTIPAYKEIHVGEQRICAAPHQKFYQSETQSWVTADALEIGAIISLDNDTPAEITAIKDVAENISTYAITVEGHEYTVTQDNIVVHNFDYPECRFYYRRTDDPYPQEEHILCIGDKSFEQECDLIAQGYTLFELSPLEAQQQEHTSSFDDPDFFQDFSREGYRDIAMHTEQTKQDYVPAKHRSPFVHEAQELRNSVLKKIEPLEKHTRLVPINGVQYAFPEDTLADTIERLSQLLKSPDYVHRLESALSNRLSVAHDMWLKLKMGGECLEKQRTFLHMILNGKLLEQLIEIQKSGCVEPGKNLDYPLEHLWPWKCEKSFLVAPTDTNEQKFIELIGINIMEAIEMASIKHHVTDSAIADYYTLYVNGDKEGLKQAQNGLVQSVAQCADRQARYYTPHLSVVTHLLRNPLHHNQIQQVHKLIPEYHAMQELSQKKGIADHERFTERIQVINDVKTQNNIQVPYLYDLTSESIVLLQQLNLNPRDYAQCQGNPLQQIVHGECIKLLERVTLIPEKSLLHDYKPHLVNCIEAARDYNQKGYYAQALMIADFCWTFIDYGYAALEGLGQGLINTAQDAYNNPLEMAATVVAGRGMAVYSLAKLLTQVARVSWDVGSIGAEYLHNPESAIEKWNDYIDPLYKAVNSADFSVHNVIKQTTAFAVQWKAQGKLIQGLHGIVNTAQKRLIAWSKQNPFKKAEDILVTTPEGIIVKVSAGEHDSNMLFSKSTSKTSGSNAAKGVAAGVQSKMREVILPKYATYEQARNKALQIIGAVDPHTGAPHIGRLGVCKDKICGRTWYEGDVVMRIDYDPIKGPHINVTDFRQGKGVNGLGVAIPFHGTKELVTNLLDPLNTLANLKAAIAVFQKKNDIKNLIRAQKILSTLQMKE